MKFENKISTKIKMIGLLLILLILSSIVVTLYLNQQNEKDALLINIAGKQRMLTQKIAKNIFYLQHNPNAKNFDELNAASEEFIQGLHILEHGDESINTYSAPTLKIQKQIDLVEELWNEFYADVEEFITLSSSDVEDKEVRVQKIIESIEKNNAILLLRVDEMVTMYTEHSESKTAYMELFQYSSAFVLLFIFIYALMRLKEIESHVDEFMQFSKKLAADKAGVKLEPIKIHAESEIVEVSDTINCFIGKINAAVDYSNEALDKSQQASLKLEELTDEFDSIIGDIQDKSRVSVYLNNSEDIAIESAEVLLTSNKKLKRLKEELDSLIASCHAIK